MLLLESLTGARKLAYLSVSNFEDFFIIVFHIVTKRTHIFSRMFEKKFLELFVVVLFWCQISPRFYKICEEHEWALKLGSFEDTIGTFFIIVAVDVVLFILMYRSVMSLYQKIKEFDARRWQKIQDKYKAKKKEMDI